MSISHESDTGREALREKTREAATQLAIHAHSARELRKIMGQVPPDQLSQTDLLAMRAGMLRNLETHEQVSAAVVRLLHKIADTL